MGFGSGSFLASKAQPDNVTVTLTSEGKLQAISTGGGIVLPNIFTVEGQAYTTTDNSIWSLYGYNTAGSTLKFLQANFGTAANSDNITALINANTITINSISSTANSAALQLYGIGYTSSAASTMEFSTYTTAGASQLAFQLSGLAVTTKNNTLDDGSGNLTATGWSWIKGKNRSYQQNLTAATTTSTSAVLLGTSISFTPKFSGYLIVSAVVRGSNNTLSDGITVSLYQGASSGALTTLLDSETYTQEGLASNQHTFVLHYELSSQTVGTATYISLAQNAVTGGTASAKIVSLSVQEV
jgi:hypothetical protein